MKKILAFFLAFAMALTVCNIGFLSDIGSLALSAEDKFIHDFDSQTFGGKTSDFVSFNVYKTVFSIDTTIKSQGTGSLKIDKDYEASFFVDNMDSMVQISYNSFMDFSSVESISLDMYFDGTFSADGELHFRFVTTENNSVGNQDGYFYKLTELDTFEANKWHTLRLSKNGDFESTAGVNCDWSKINRIYILFKNPNKVHEPNMYFDNLVANYPEVSSETSSEETSAQVSSVPIESSVPDTVSSSVANSFKYGDVDQDGEVKSNDALLTLQYAVGKIPLEDLQRKAAEVTADGEIKSTDALYILQYSVKKISSFPIDEIEIPPQVPELTISIPEAPFDNGAYATDNPDNSDRSFVLTGEGLVSKTAYTISAAFINSNNDVRRLLTSLQGLVNRDFGRDGMHESIMYILDDNVADGFWYNQMTVEGSVFEDFEKVTIRNWDAFVSYFTPQLKQCGMVLWDPDVPATSNVAATICGIDGYLPVMSGSQLHKTLLELGVEVKMNLDGMFTGSGNIPGTSIASTGSAKNDAYRWALEKYMDRCSDTYIAYTLDGAQCVEGTKFNQDSDANEHCIQNHDYLIARRCFFFDLSCRNDRAADDDPNQRVGLDRETMLMIFQRRYDRAGGKFGQIFGFPPWWMKYIYTGTTGEAVGNEWMFSELITCFNLAKEADAASPAFMSNGSAYYKYVFMTKDFKNTEPTDTSVYNSDTHYFTFYIGDYDSSAWLKKYVRLYWKADEARGTLPLNWGFNPNLSDRVPVVYDYVCKNMTDNDFLIAGDSGAGYVVPSGLTKGKYLAQSGYTRTNPSAGDVWTEYCRKYYSRFDIDITGFILNSANELTNIEFDIYNSIATGGGLHIDAGNKMVHRNGVPYIHMDTGYSSTAALYNYSFGTMSGYNFSACRTIIKSPSELKGYVEDFIAYSSARGKNVKYVDIYTFFRLAKESGQLTAK